MTFRLLHMASENWPTLEGWATSRNTDISALPIDRLLNLIYYWATRNAQDENDLAKFDRKLWMPPKGEEPPPESPWSAANETSAFQAFKAQVQPDKPPSPSGATTARATPRQRGSLANSNGTPGSRGRPARGR